jgi:photosystem II stability/assembly factor-like uncharacterized protein
MKILRHPMKKKSIVLIPLIFFLLACENEFWNNTGTEAPKAITIIQGDNQVGYPGCFLKDTIIIEITPGNIEDLDRYSYRFKTYEYHTIVVSYDTIVDHKLYIHSSWRLDEREEQELVLLLNAEPANERSSASIELLDSISIFASKKPPWKNLFKGNYEDFCDMHFSSELDGIAIGDVSYKNGYLKTHDGGETWSYTNSYTEDIDFLSFADPDTGIAIVSNNYALFTTDGGQSFFKGEWTPPIAGDKTSSDYFMLNSRDIITVGSKGAIAKTKDGGISWIRYEGFTFTNYLFDITCLDDETCYACGQEGLVLKTIDGGESWEANSLQLNNYLRKIYFIDRDHGFAAGEKGAFVRTVDGGDSWEIIQTGLEYNLIEIHFKTREEGYIVSRTGEIGKTIDGGLTWEVLNKGFYGVFYLRKAYFKGNKIFGLEEDSIFTYDLSDD